MLSFTKKIFLLIAIWFPIFLTGTAFADNGNLNQVEGFIKSIITAIAGLAGLMATGFFVVGGYRYITSSGNPQHLEKAKRTIMYSAAGLAITIGAFVLTNIVSSLATSAFGSLIV
jgi:TRAP-type C4-dicarboxylate transport system permease small subunit